ncbi:uncharacterized protein LOC129764841 [Toxorhynchites rutilus septentrionalis]|uniref:uncharacterized protein LOC129764841 n=1 Tax=Toxorhynchites rutilus septentrionalis TaxID=329112 RepID=UPI00247ADB62|nr:uncharacterized protein LOC129764841 [Toxorhynchites rutilus septentrionalis]XP_055620339.1 uncharacterized protein LOC129764841 [Toxorhynchites rutilus septentrionalis]XP_055620340.1 uncharacterized protein LOC129764841 [Toxorhynchites rutilus septentrionalis]XP_055620341.1 uncharacterized protein LOC129764841 [Toxorhynchites rutilus septentrionalis]XP_055620342.1 uncharacterized protein LOC129764841 [Toxorhynchites rutilus septentrionalis]XP_055620343.1 uncharacterized protein LOC12976484
MATTMEPSRPPSPPPPAAPSPPPAVPLRSKVSPKVPPPSYAAVDHPSPAAPIQPSTVVVGGIRVAQHKEILSENHRNSSPSFKALSNDLSELLVKNLSIKRGETCAERCANNVVGAEDPSAANNCVVALCENSESDSLHLINRKPNRNSLCDTFSSVNKLIKLKRVSSDSSGNLSGYTKFHSGNIHSINPPPQAKFKRVEISVQQLPSECVAPRKNIIVNQFEQLVPDESDSVHLLLESKPGSRRSLTTEDQQHQQQCLTEEQGELAKKIVDSENCDNLAVKVRRRVHHPSRGGTRGAVSTLESVEEEHYKRRSLQWPLGLSDWGGSGIETATTIIADEADVDGVGEERKRKHPFRHSWNAPGYDLLLEEERRTDSRKDFASIVHNLAGLRSTLTNGGTQESASLLEPPIGGPKPSMVPGGGGGGGGGNGGVDRSGRRSTASCVPSSPVVPSVEASHTVSLGGPVPRKRRLEAFLKSLVGRRPSKEPLSTTTSPPPVLPIPPQSTTALATPPLLPSPEIKISLSPSEHNLVEMTRSRLNISTTSLSSVHQKLWSVVPLLKKDVSCNSLASPKSVPLLGSQSTAGLRKCETVLALTNSTQVVEPIKPQNRLRNCDSVATCSRCSSLLSLAAVGSRYSLNLSNGGFVAVNGTANTVGLIQPNTTGQSKHVGSLLRLTKTSSGSSSSSSSPCASSSYPSASSNSTGTSSSSSSGSRVSVTSKAAMLAPPSPTFVSGVPLVALVPAASSALNPIVKFTCKLCLGEYSAENLTRISQCDCSFCTECMTAYIEFEISEGAYEVSCPDAMCPAQGIITIGEIATLASPSLVEKHHRYRLNREVELDKFRTWCPKAGCETICLVGQHHSQQSSNLSSDRIVQLQQPSSSNLSSPCAVHCPTCREDFCSGCKKAWHPTMSCEENSRRLAADGQTDAFGIPFDNDLIKCCPMCTVPIEKDEGCAQMMCKRCKHVFCWYCLASLDDDFLLRHYDKGPCKNKLGHSRASVVWHRAQVIGIFAGFGILLLVASPLLLLAAPCIVCCKCRICSGAAKLEETEVDYDDAAVALQSSR